MFMAAPHASAQRVAVKTNVLYGAFMTPNLAAEISIAPNMSVELSGGYNPWNRNPSAGESNKRSVHYLIQPEFRYWLLSTYGGHFFGGHLLFSQFNFAERKRPLYFGKGSEEYHFDGFSLGLGVSYGYMFHVAPRWRVELAVGLGYARMNYDKFECTTCGRELGREIRNYFGPTKATASIVFLIN